MTCRTTLGVIGLAAAGACVNWSLYLLQATRRHRIDLRPGQSYKEGASRVWVCNVYCQANYTSEGRPALWRLWGANALALIMSALAIYCLALG